MYNVYQYMCGHRIVATQNVNIVMININEKKIENL